MSEVSQGAGEKDSLSAELFRAGFEAAGIGLALSDDTGRMLSVNAALHRILGYEDGKLVGRSRDELLFANDLAIHRQIYHDAVSRGREGHKLETRYRAADGRAVWVAVRAYPVQGDEGTTVFLAVIEDISEQKRFERHLRYQAQHDELTGLPNRALLQERLQRLVHGPEGEFTKFALLCLGLTRFRELSDTFGQVSRDRVLQQLATRLRGALVESDTVARMGDDEFGVLLPRSIAHEAQGAARRLLSLLNRPFDLGEQSVDIGGSVGIVCFPEHGADSKTLLARAETAMQAAREQDLGFVVFDEDLGERQARRLALARSLRRAIERGELILHYQPKVEFDTGRVDGAEALVRWQHPVYGLLYPSDFVPVAEDAGLIKQLTRWVLHEALKQSRRWRDEGIELRVVVNFSPRVLHDSLLVEMVHEALRSERMDPTALGLEITEDAVMADPLRALSTLGQLHEMGINISIDDFGTGYSSFAYLDQLPASELKIDRSFVKDMVDNASHFRIVHGTIDIGHDLGLRTVAEGIEDRETLEALAGLGCDTAQGFYLSEPLPGEAFSSWVRERHAGNHAE